MTELHPKIRERLLETKARLEQQTPLAHPTPAQLETFRARFRERFGPERLRQVDGEALLQLMHGKEGEGSLAYWIEFKSDDEFHSKSFGSIAGGSAAKFGIYQRAETGEWTTGQGRTQRILSVEEAVVQARAQRDQLLRGVALLEALPANTSDDTYAALQRDMNAHAPLVADAAWGHKYFALLFPEKLDDYHVRDYQEWHLICLLQVPPAEGGRFACAGRFVALAQELGWTIPTLSQVLSELDGGPVDHYVVDLAQLAEASQELPQLLVAERIMGFPGAAAGDLTEIGNEDWKKELNRRVSRAYPQLSGSELSRKTTQLGWFYSYAQSGARVLLARGPEVMALGQITGDYRFMPDSPLPHQRPVKWHSDQRWSLPVAERAVGGTFDKLTDPRNLVAVDRALLELGEEELCVTPPAVAAGTRRHPVPQLPGTSGRIQAILERKGQVILYGPPGTGKTHWALRTSRELAALEEHGRAYDALPDEAQKAIRSPAGRVRLCNFHPSFGYEDFIEGYRPHVEGAVMQFVLRDGAFKQLCQAAAACQAGLTYYLIVDEINRGDVPRIFGELLTLLELDKRGETVVLPSGAVFSVPKNVRVIGTMNTADRSIALLDAALRRRFGFVELMPQPELLDGVSIQGLPLGPWLRRLNQRIVSSVRRDARNLQIGHAYFLEGTRAIRSAARFAQILREDVIPLLEEYCYENFETLGELLGPALVDVGGQRIRDELFAAGRTEDLINAVLGRDHDLAATSQATAEAEPSDEGEPLPVSVGELPA